MASIRFLPAAERDLEEIYTFTLSQWGSSQARRYLRGLRQSLERLSVFPAIGRETLRDTGIRVWSYQSHRMVYRATEDALVVSRIFHAARDIDLLLAHYAALQEKSGE